MSPAHTFLVYESVLRLLAKQGGGAAAAGGAAQHATAVAATAAVGALASLSELAACGHVCDAINDTWVCRRHTRLTAVWALTDVPWIQYSPHHTLQATHRLPAIIQTGSTLSSGFRPAAMAPRSQPSPRAAHRCSVRSMPLPGGRGVVAAE